ncbi:MAG: DUF4290 domain-containing protein [Muribaculaceae bacterium]|nr:DUF4290 domain-containing protein [Muribaculaceae bacterium]MDE6366060.1 DUF4290 domain-containing protein [Muribaculaceae bacterium]
MLQYNTKKSALPMPEYGRNVQQMVDHCLTLESRDERNACARAIVDTICRLNPQLRTNPEWRAKLWDHLAIMSDFKLDIDYPSEPVTPETLTSRPAKVEIPQHRIPKRVYGANILKMIEAAKAMDPADPDREMLVMLLANHMKKLLLNENPEAATDARIFADLAQLSEGHILLNPDETRLREYEMLQVPGQNKKKRRRR